MHQHYAKHHAGQQVLPDAYEVSAGEARRLWNEKLHNGEVPPLRPYQQPPKPALPWTFNLEKPHEQMSGPGGNGQPSAAAIAATLGALFHHQQQFLAQQQQQPSGDREG